MEIDNAGKTGKPGGKGLPPAAKTAIFVATAILIVVLCGHLLAWRALERVEGNAKAFLEQSLGSQLEVQKTEITHNFRIVLSGIKGKDREVEMALPDFTIDKVKMAVDIPSLMMGNIELREVSVEGIMLRIYRDSDGVFNFERWIKKTGTCDYDAFLKKFPRKISISGGSIVVEPLPGTSMHESVRAAKFSGAMGITKQGDVGMILSADAFRSALHLEGGFKPCGEQALDMNVLSDVFDFSGAREMINKFTGEKSPDRLLPSGSGKLKLSIHGSVGEVRVDGAVQARDFDAGFSYASGTLSVRDFNAGIGRKRANGSGSVDLRKKGLPYKFSIRLENLSVEELIGKKFAAGFSPVGNFSGMMDVSGALENDAMALEKGSITIENGWVRFPVPDVEAMGSRVAELPFKRLVGGLSTQDGKIRITGIDIEGEGWTANGSATLGAIVPDALFNAGMTYSLTLNLKADNAKVFAEKIPHCDGKLGGALDMRVAVRGVVGNPSETRGDGSVSIKKGFVINPYDTLAPEAGKTINFDSAEASFDIYREKLGVKKVDVNGEGLNIRGDGAIGFDGSLALSAKAKLSPERAAQFSGLALEDAEGDGKSLVTYDVDCSIIGTIKQPVSRWGRPAVTRWDGE